MPEVSSMKLRILAAACLLLLLTACARPSLADQLDQIEAAAPTTAATTTTTQSPILTGSAAENEKEPFTFEPSDGLTDEGLFEGVEALRYVTLPDYRSVQIPSYVHTPTDEAVDGRIETLLADFRYPEQILDREVADGDAVNIDFVGSIGGVEFQGGSTQGQGTTVVIGVTQYIDDFLEQLIGHKPGDTFDVEVTFPENYGNEALNGKDAVFVTTINYIEGELLTPELTDEFVAEKLQPYYECSTVADLRETLRQEMAEENVTDYLRSYLLDNAGVTEIPESMVEYQRNTLLLRYASYAASYGFDLDEFIAMASGSESREALLEKNADAILENARYFLIMQAVAEDAGLRADDAAVKDYFERYLGISDYSEYIEGYGEPYLRFTVLNSLVNDHLRDSAVKG